jgi:shikimate kinase
VFQRVRHDRKRPLLQVDDPLARLKALHAERDPLYRETAHLALDTRGLDSGEISTGILESARYFFTGHA